MLLHEFVKDFGIKKYFRTPTNIKYSLLANFIQLVLEGEWVGKLEIPKNFALNEQIGKYFRPLDTNVDSLRFGDMYIVLSSARYRYGVFLNDETVIEQPNHLQAQHEILKYNVEKNTAALKARGHVVIWLRPLNEKNLFPDYMKDANVYKLPTVASMKPIDLPEGMIVETDGYYRSDDGGGAKYKILSGDYPDNGAEYHKLNNGNTAQLISSSINVRMFGAKGDGETDDFIQFQKALDYAYDKMRFRLFVPKGVYNTSKPLRLKTYGESSTIGYWEGTGVKLYGEDMSTSKIIKTGNDVLTDINPTVNNVDATIIFQSGVSANGNTGRSTGTGLQDLFLQNNSTSTSSYVVTGEASIRGNYWNLNIKGYRGMKFGNSFSSRYKSIFFHVTREAFRIESGTSNSYEFMYASNAIDPYYMLNAYSIMNTVCADTAKGVIFTLGGSSNVMASCGTESEEATTILKTTPGSSVIVDSLYCFRQTGTTGVPIENCVIFDVANDSTLKVNSVTILEQRQITSGLSYIVTNNAEANTNFFLDNIYFRRNYTGTPNQPMLVSKNLQGSLSAGRFSSNYGSFHLRRNRYMPYIGSRRNDTITSTIIKPKAIYLDNETKYTNANGDNLEYQQKYNQGDVLLMNDPDNFNALGLVTLDSGAAFVRDGTYAEIPIVRRGTTANRPGANRFVGLEYYDTSLGIPVWWSGSAWKNAMGTNV